MTFSEEQIQRLKIMRFLAQEISEDNNIISKGGTGLLLAYGLDRYSEDMDFDIPNGTDVDISQKVKKMAENLGITDYQLNVKKDTDTTKRYMLHYGATLARGAYPLKVEFSKRNKNMIMYDKLRKIM